MAPIPRRGLFVLAGGALVAGGLRAVWPRGLGCWLLGHQWAAIEGPGRLAFVCRRCGETLSDEREE